MLQTAVKGPTMNATDTTIVVDYVIALIFFLLLRPSMIQKIFEVFLLFDPGLGCQTLYNALYNSRVPSALLCYLDTTVR